MRMIVSWDGSGHALGALRSVVGLFREQSVEHVEVVLRIWPPNDIARWSDIRQQQLVADDLHRAAAEVAANEVQLLEAVLSRIAQTIGSATPDGPFVAAIADAIERTRADLLFVLAGAHDASGTIEEAMRSVVEQSKIPTLILRSPAVSS